jgi:hypothetical protein
MTGIKYVCSFRTSDGELREVVVELSPDEIADCERHFRGGNGPGVPNGPLPRMYATRRASRSVPPWFKPDFDEIRLVQ